MTPGTSMIDNMVYKDRIEKMYPIAIEYMTIKDPKDLAINLKNMDPMDAYVLGMIMARIFYNITEDRRLVE